MEEEHDPKILGLFILAASFQTDYFICQSLNFFICNLRLRLLCEFAMCKVSQFRSVTQLCLCHSMDCSSPGFPVHHQLLELAQTHVHQVSDAIQPSHPLLSLLPSIFPSIRVLSSESALCIRWPKYWSFNFSIEVEASVSSFVWVRLSDSVLVNRIKQKCQCTVSEAASQKAL